MKPFFRLLCLAAVVALALSAAAAEGDDVVMNGSFVWQRPDANLTGDLRAVFTPRGDGEWDVTFHFVWEDEPHVYAGSASGSLSAGPLEGSVKGDDEDHDLSFRFSGNVENATFTGTHGYLGGDGNLKHAGTLTLAAAP